MLEKEVDCLGIILSDFVNKNFRLGQHDNIELLILNRYKQVTRSQAKHLASLIK